MFASPPPPFPKNLLIQTVTHYILASFYNNCPFVYGNKVVANNEAKSIMD